MLQNTVSTPGHWRNGAPVSQAREADDALRPLLDRLRQFGFKVPPLFGAGKVYVIQNGRLDIPPEAVRESFPELARTAIGEMMASSTQGTLMRAYFASIVHGYQFNTVEVPPGVDIGKDPLAFDPKQMQAGFDAGYALGKTPDPWSKVPPLLGDLPQWMVDIVREKF